MTASNMDRQGSHILALLRSTLNAAMLAWLVLIMLAALPAQASEERVALVIGNDAYPNDPLRNAVNDAQQIAKTLTGLGFKVVVKTNADFKTMRAAAVEFANLLDNNHAAVFYFAGHGIQYRGKNYLVPVDAKLSSESEVVFNALEVTQILERMQDANIRHKFLILDACRNNPFRAVFGNAASQGLAKMNTPPGTTIAFAAQANAVAEDGRGENGVYTKNLLRELKKPDLHASLMFQQVSQAVQQETAGRQTPEVQSVPASKGHFFFNDSRLSGTDNAAGSRTSAETEAKLDLEFWSTVKDSTRAEDFRAYLEQFPNGRFAALARSRIDGIARQPTSAARPAAPSTPSAPAATPAASATSAKPEPQPAKTDNAPAVVQVADARNAAPQPAADGDNAARSVSDKVAALSPRPSAATAAPQDELLSGTVDFGSGIRYTGQYKETSRGRVLHGKGDFVAKDHRYSGDYREGKKHGQGTYIFPNGDKYEGDFVDDLPNGKGKYHFVNGDTYEGEIVGGRISGKGVYTTKGKDRIEAAFIDAKANGHGVYLFASGDKYEGELKGGALTGKGVYTTKSNDRIVATFVDGIAQGEGVYYFANSDRYEGEMKGGALTGKGKYFYSNGMRSEGNFVNGMLKGKGVFHFNDGSAFEGEFIDGLKNAKGYSIGKDGARREAVIIDSAVKITGG